MNKTISERQNKRVEEATKHIASKYNANHTFTHTTPNMFQQDIKKTFGKVQLLTAEYGDAVMTVINEFGLNNKSTDGSFVYFIHGNTFGKYKTLVICTKY